MRMEPRPAQSRAMKKKLLIALVFAVLVLAAGGWVVQPFTLSWKDAR